jgi:hypothetical protein
MCMLFHHIHMITGLLAERLNSHNQVLGNVYLSLTTDSYDYGFTFSSMVVNELF